MKTIHIAIIGAGTMARQHILAFQDQANVKIQAIHSRTRSKAEVLAQEFNIPIVANSITELYEQSKAQLVIVCVPELQANAVAKACFKLNWTVLLEKPAGYHWLDANDIAEAALQAPQAVFVAFNRRFYQSALSIAADLNARDEPRYIRVQDQQNFSEARAHQHPEEVVQKFMYANSIHVIDLICYFARGNITKVVPIVPWQGDATQIMLGYVEFDSGDKALYEGIWQGPGPWACSISTPSRRWEMRPLEKAIVQNKNERTLSETASDPLDTSYKAGFYRQAEEICKAVRGEKNQAVSIQESLKTMELIHKLFQV